MAEAFAEVRGRVPPHLKVPRWLATAILIAVASGIVLGLVTANDAIGQAVRAVFFASAFAYLGVSLFDFREHFLLEKEVAGRYLAWKAVPPGESINHALTVLTLLTVLIFARRPPPVPELRDWVTMVIAPALFFILGWRDELVYHRRRSVHREDIMHTTAHLAAGVMLSSLVAMRFLAD
jgi:hypothetical protein